MGAAMFGLCGAMALLISIVGLYGVVSFAVARRTKEIGIRMALGAARSQVLGMVLRQGSMKVHVRGCPALTSPTSPLLTLRTWRVTPSSGLFFRRLSAMRM